MKREPRNGRPRDPSPPSPPSPRLVAPRTDPDGAGRGSGLDTYKNTTPLESADKGEIEAQREGTEPSFQLLHGKLAIHLEKISIENKAFTILFTYSKRRFNSIKNKEEENTDIIFM